MQDLNSTLMETDKCPKIKVNAKLGYLSRPDGSVLFSSGDTTVSAGVYAPVEIKQDTILIDKAFVKVQYRPKVGHPGVADKLRESVVRNVCESAIIATLYPRAGVNIIVQEMENGGGLLPCAVNASCLCLLDSGLDMRFLVAAISCILNEGGSLQVDPNTEQHKNAKATFTFVFDSINQHIIASHTTGKFNLEKFECAISLCRKSSATIFEYYEAIIRSKYPEK